MRIVVVQAISGLFLLLALSSSLWATPTPLTIVATAGANGTISPSGTVTVNNGANQGFTITPNTGYRVADVLVDGSSVGPVPSYTFTCVTANHTIAASFAVAPPVISVNPTSLQPSCQQGQNAASQSFEIWNSGGGTLSYSITASANWLSVSPTSGTSTGEHGTITVNYATSGLAVGTCNATITITASGASNTPQTIPVTLTVNPSSGVSSQKWSFATKSCVRSSPAIGADGTIYVGSWDNNLYAVNPDGSQKWAFATGSYVFSSPAIGADGTVYVGSWDGKLYAVNPGGSQKWAFATGDRVWSSPAIGADGTIYVGSGDQKLYAVNPDGSQKWAFATRSYVDSSPAIGADGTIYVASYDNKLYAVNPDGSQKWAFAAGNGSYQNLGQSSPAIGADGTIYVGSFDGKLYAVNPDGSQKWAFATGSLVDSSPAIGADGTIYVGSWDNNLYAVNPDGTQKWAFWTNANVSSSPAIGADGTVYVGSGANLYAVKPDGSQWWAFTTGDWVSSSPAIGADSTVYVGSYDNKLYAIYSSSMGLVKSPWPKFHHENQNTGRYNAPFSPKPRGRSSSLNLLLFD